MAVKRKAGRASEEDIIVGLDVGTTKICVIVARVKDDKNIAYLYFVSSKKIIKTEKRFWVDLSEKFKRDITKILGENSIQIK